MFGLLNVNKPAGPTSHDIVARVRRMLPRKTKVGHAGTLDPFATGVLVVCVGPATRLADYVADQAKQYVTEAHLGYTSATDDIEGELMPTGVATPAPEAVRAALAGFVGRIQQVPPAHSAVHVDGKRAYQLARADKKVDLPSRTIRIDDLELISLQGDIATIRMDCGKGAYVRALVRDLGRKLGCGAYCQSLIRTRIGQLSVENAIEMGELTHENLPGRLHPPRLAVADWPTVTLSDAEEAEIRMGRAISRQPIDAANVAAVDATGQLVALCTPGRTAGWLQPKKVFAT